jgi:hypothetical protein
MVLGRTNLLLLWHTGGSRAGNASGLGRTNLLLLPWRSASVRGWTMLLLRLS